MLVPALLIEAGVWIGWFGAKLTARAHRREILINGTKAVRTFWLIDRKLERETRSASSVDRKLAMGITRGLRFFVSTRAFELVVLKMGLDHKRQAMSMLHKSDIDTEVKLHL